MRVYIQGAQIYLDSKGTVGLLTILNDAADRALVGQSEGLKCYVIEPSKCACSYT